MEFKNATSPTLNVDDNIDAPETFNDLPKVVADPTLKVEVPDKFNASPNTTEPDTFNVFPNVVAPSTSNVPVRSPFLNAKSPLEPENTSLELVASVKNVNWDVLSS